MKKLIKVILPISGLFVLNFFNVKALSDDSLSDIFKSSNTIKSKKIGREKITKKNKKIQKGFSFYLKINNLDKRYSSPIFADIIVKYLKKFLIDKFDKPLILGYLFKNFKIVEYNNTNWLLKFYVYHKDLKTLYKFFKNKLKGKKINDLINGKDEDNNKIKVEINKDDFIEFLHAYYEKLKEKLDIFYKKIEQLYKENKFEEMRNIFLDFYLVFVNPQNIFSSLTQVKIIKKYAKKILIDLKEISEKNLKRKDDIDDDFYDDIDDFDDADDDVYDDDKDEYYRKKYYKDEYFEDYKKRYVGDKNFHNLKENLSKFLRACKENIKYVRAYRKYIKSLDDSKLTDFNKTLSSSEIKNKTLESKKEIESIQVEREVIKN